MKLIPILACLLLCGCSEPYNHTVKPGDIVVSKTDGMRGMVLYTYRDGWLQVRFGNSGWTTNLQAFEVEKAQP